MLANQETSKMEQTESILNVLNMADKILQRGQFREVML